MGSTQLKQNLENEEAKNINVIYQDIIFTDVIYIPKLRAMYIITTKAMEKSLMWNNTVRENERWVLTTGSTMMRYWRTQSQKKSNRNIINW